MTVITKWDGICYKVWQKIITKGDRYKVIGITNCDNYYKVILFFIFCHIEWEYSQKTQERKNELIFFNICKTTSFLHMSYNFYLTSTIALTFLCFWGARKAYITRFFKTASRLILKLKTYEFDEIIISFFLYGYLKTLRVAFSLISATL